MKGLSVYPTETQITLGIKATVLITAVIILFSQDLIIIFKDALYSKTTSYLLAIPVLFTYLIYRKRKMLRTVIHVENENEPKEIRYIPQICGVLLSITATLLYWHGSYTFTPLEYHMLSLPIFTAGLTLILFNPQTLRQLAFPVAFLTFLTPPPSEILYAVGSTLSMLSSEASNTIVNALGIPSTITSEYGNSTITITRPDGTPLNFTVDIACSGIYSLIGFLIFAVFVAYIIRDKTWKKLALIILGIPIVYSLNIIRITIILILCYHYGEALALQAFHLLGGWVLIFLGTLLLLATSEKIFKTQIFTNPTENCPRCTPTPKFKESFCIACGRILKPPELTSQKDDVAKIAAITASIILLLSIQAPVFALTQGPPIVIINTPSGQKVSTDIFPQISNYTLSFWSRDTEFEQKAKQDMSLIYLYSPVNQSGDLIWVTIEIAPTHSSLHRWETCLITWPLTHGKQPKVTQIELKDIQILENPPIISRYFAFNYTQTHVIQTVLYWYETATFTTNSTAKQEHVKISLIVYPENMKEMPEIENQLTTVAREIAEYWQPIKTWSQITLLISQNGITLTAATITILTATIIVYTLERRKQRKANTNAYQKLSEPNRQIIDAVQKTEKTTLPTLNNIAKTYRKTTKKSIRKKRLLQKLLELEKTGLIESRIANKQDEPIQTWRTQI